MVFVETSYNVAFALSLGATLLTMMLLLSYKKNTIRRKGKEAALLAEDFWVESPLIKSEWLSSFIGNGCVVNLKLDLFQPSSSYKIRGVSTFMKEKYSLNEKIDTFITTTSSNTGLAVAYTAKKLNCKCLVIRPEKEERETEEKENEEKENEEIEDQKEDQKEDEKEEILCNKFEDDYGAEITFHGKTLDEAEEYAVNLDNHENGNYWYVPSFDESSLIHGFSSIITELYHQYEDNVYPECIILSVDNGDFLNGILGGLFQVNWCRYTTVIAAESENNAPFNAAIKNSYKSQIISNNKGEYNIVAQRAMNIAKRYNAFNPIKSIVVKDLDVLNICTLCGIKENLLIEPQSGIALAALYKNKHYFKQFENICVIVGCGNDVYFNKELLKKSQKNGQFNDKSQKMLSKSSDLSDNNNYDEDAYYDSDTEEM